MLPINKWSLWYYLKSEIVIPSFKFCYPPPIQKNFGYSSVIFWLNSTGMLLFKFTATTPPFSYPVTYKLSYIYINNYYYQIISIHTYLFISLSKMEKLLSNFLSFIIYISWLECVVILLDYFTNFFTYIFLCILRHNANVNWVVNWMKVTQVQLAFIICFKCCVFHNDWFTEMVNWRCSQNLHSLTKI